MAIEAIVSAILLAQAAPAAPDGSPPPPVAQAEVPATWSPPPPRRGFQGALALQYAVPGGRAAQGMAHDDLVLVAIELEAQAGLKITDRFFVGVYVAGGPAVPGTDTLDVCRDQNLKCNGSTSRLGVLARWDLAPGDAGNLWFGAGTGVESLDVETFVSSGALAPLAATPQSELRGWEIVRLLAGIDYRAGRVFGFGVYGSLSIGRYADVKTSEGALVATTSGAGHTWFTLGVRGLLFP